MPQVKDYFQRGSHETVSDSDHDQQIRQAPYLPRVQIWARDDGPYTLRVGNQWFHCDDLVINGTEYRQKASKATQPRQATPSNHAVYPPPSSRRPAASRAQSYQRTRPDKSPKTATPVIHQDTARLATQDQYQPQSLPTPREQAEIRKAERRRQRDVEAQKQAQLQQDRPRRDSGVSVGTDTEPSNGALVPWQPRPPIERQVSQQARPARPRPGRKGSSFDIPVRSKTKKNVRFAGLP